MSAPWTLLVVAKAPVAGLAKTRLAADVGDRRAADLAAAALLDTLEAGATAPRVVVALTGDLDRAERRDDLGSVLGSATVVAQRGDGFDVRLAAAHADAGPGPVVQVGMDTPQVTAGLLSEVAAGLETHDAVLGPADDGGWWVLALRDPADAEALVGVPMSTDHTFDDTLQVLRARGLDVATAAMLTDVDTTTDADVVADGAPSTRFGRAWLSAREEVA